LYFPDEDLHLPLSLNGCISYLPTRIPSDHEIQNCTWVTLTSDEIWEPYSDTFQEQEKLAQQRHFKSTRADFLEPYLNLPTHQDDFDLLLGSISSTFLPMNPKQSLIKLNNVGSLNSSNQKTIFNPKVLSDKSGIGDDTALQTLKITTQKFIRSAINPIERRYRTAHQQLRYRQLSGPHGRFYSDTLFSTLKSINGHSCGQIFIYNMGFYHFVHMAKESDAWDALLKLVQQVGIPSAIVTDGAKVLTLGEWKKITREYHVKTYETEPYSPWQNRAEGAIRELKRHTLRLMHKSSCPRHFWDYCCLLVIVSAETPDISEYASFSWYQPA